MTATDRLVEQHTSEIVHAILAAAGGSPTEAEFRQPVEELLDDFAATAGVELRTHHEYALAVGRADTVYNRLVIEYKRPGHLGDSLNNRNNQAALAQLRGYIEDIERQHRIKKARLMGVVTDGRRIIFARFMSGRWQPEQPAVVDETSIAWLLRLLVQLQSGAALIPSNLIEDFGSETLTAQRTTRALYSALENSDDTLVQALFRQWQTFFGEVTGHDESASRLRGKKEFKKFAKGMGLKAAQVDPPHLFFAVHTYFALLIKLIAWLTVSRYMTRQGAPFAALAQLPSADLQRELQAMERGGVFRDYGLRNFLEGDFFGWYLRAWDDNIEQYVRKILEDLGRYDPATLEVEPELTRDLLKQLYQYLVPRHLRHDLGEYYTPDWLAQRVLNMVDSGKYEGDPHKRLLDPACGSGTFLVLAIKATRAYCRQHGIPDADALALILANVVGIDLNPLAVVAARTNYLLALGELLQARGDQPLDIPVYLADSILTPVIGRDLFGANKYQIKTSVGLFQIPRACATRERIDALATLLDESVHDPAVDADGFLARARAEIGLSTAEFYAADTGLRALYQQMVDLHVKGLNGVWARIIKNAFAPIFLEPFDFVVGNPPWVNWENLPEVYRQDTLPVWEYYDLFIYKGQLGKMREGKKDISMLMTYVALDRYLRSQGKLGFVITQSVFKTTGAGQGFRRFHVGEEISIDVLHVDDMSAVKPFEGASNRTAVMVMQKGQPTQYPIPYTLWHRVGRRQRLEDEDTLEEVLTKTTRLRFVAEPVDKHDLASPWLSGRRYALEAVRKVIGPAEYQARMGSNTGGANGVYWLEVIDHRPDGLLVVSNLIKGARRKVEKIQTVLEPDLVYPLLRGRDISCWSASPAAYILTVQDREKQREGIPENRLKRHFPKTYNYLLRFRNVLAVRPDRRYYPEGSPFYTMRNVAEYTFKPHKVVWREVAHDLQAAVAEQSLLPNGEFKVIIPDHTAILVACESPDEAHFVCAVLNSSPSQFTVRNYIVLHPDPHILERVHIPLYDSAQPIHCQLASFSQRAHQAAAVGDTVQVQKVEAEIDRLAARLWGLDDQELADIQRSLEELS